MSNYSDHKSRTNTCSYTSMGAYSTHNTSTAPSAAAHRAKSSDIVVIPQYGLSANSSDDFVRFADEPSACGGYPTLASAYGCSS